MSCMEEIMKKIKTRFIATMMIGILAISDVTVSNASTSEIDNSTYLENESIVTEKTGIEDINSDIYSTNDSLLVADGYEALIEVPSELNAPITISDGLGETMAYSLPENVSNLTGTLINDTVIYTDKDSDISYGVQALQLSGRNEQTIEGVRTTVTIDNYTAPNRYEFTYHLNEGQKMVSSAEYLGEEYDTNEVFIVNRENEVEYVIEAPWAKDANGNDVPTCYEIEGDTLVQIVDFNKDSAFPIVADPSVWQIAKCTASVVWLVASSVFAVAKITKIKKYIKALGGVKETVSLLIGATSIAEKGAAAGETLLKLAEILLGVDQVVDNCPGIKSTFNKLKQKFS